MSPILIRPLLLTHMLSAGSLHVPKQSSMHFSDALMERAVPPPYLSSVFAKGPVIIPCSISASYHRKSPWSNSFTIRPWRKSRAMLDRTPKLRLQDVFQLLSHVDYSTLYPQSQTCYYKLSLNLSCFFLDLHTLLHRYFKKAPSHADFLESVWRLSFASGFLIWVFCPVRWIPTLPQSLVLK